VKTVTNTKRKVFLGDCSIFLEGSQPKYGQKLANNITAKPARKTKEALGSTQLSQGLVFVSTLPNIRSFACSQQVLDLEVESKKKFPKSKIFHIASDLLHPFLSSPGFTLCGLSKDEKERFKSSFGVGVENENRIAHGLFALLDGKFIASYIPRQQYGVPNIKLFLNKVEKNLKLNASSKV
jgi:peroxiredoxin